MDVVVLGQPDKDGRSIRVELQHALGWNDATSGWFAVAWAKRSGLALLEAELRTFGRTGRPLRALIGIDQHGGTVEGLEMALDLFGEARIYHDSNPARTFHPKLYVIKAPTRARVIVGSGNLTAGGLCSNYEISIRADLDLADKGDQVVLADFENWFHKRWKEKRATVHLSKAAIERLIDDPKVVVTPEAWGPPRSASKLRGQKPGGSVFGAAVHGLAAVPRLAMVSGADVQDGLAGVRNMSEAPSSNYRQLILAAGLPKDRWGQAGFNRAVAQDFFGVSVNGDEITAFAVRQNGTTLPRAKRRLISASSNQNHRIELPEPDGRDRPSTGYPIVLARRLSKRRVRYMYLMPTDRGYKTMQGEIAKRAPVGLSRKSSTKRVYLTLGELQAVLPSSPLVLR